MAEKESRFGTRSVRLSDQSSGASIATFGKSGAEYVSVDAHLSQMSERTERRRQLFPFLKWPGGKRWLLELYPGLLPLNLSGRYIEPFLGGGAMFFGLKPENAILSDACGELMCAYRGVRNQLSETLRILRIHAENHSNAYFYQIRSYEPRTLADRAARFVYLNRTCFNGIYRVNRQGKFNVPLGSRSNVLMGIDTFPEWSKALRAATLLHSDFESVIDDARKGDFVFADPPYTVRHNNNGFIKYNEVLFSWSDQLRLYESLDRARSRGVRILMTNANHESVRKLYAQGFCQQVVSRYSPIAASSVKRDRYEEVVISA